MMTLEDLKIENQPPDLKTGMVWMSVARVWPEELVNEMSDAW